MSFHNLDEEDFGSDDSSDEDYVPCEVGNQVSEEENSGEDEFLSLPDGDEEDEKRGKKRKKVVTKRNKKQKVSAREEIAPAKEETTEKVEVENGGASEETNKKRVDTLWADFLKDVGGPTKNSKEGSTETTTTTSSQKSEKVTIVKEYDFAGETVRISTQVDASSKEAKEEEKRKSFCPPVTPQPQVAPSTSTPSPSFGLKKPAAGLSGLLDKLQKKPKMTILEKSKLDWSNFKDKEGIGEELQQHIRGKKGYLEKKAFLERADYRQFEIERDMRLAVRKAT